MTIEADIILRNIDEFNQSIRDEFVRKGINDTKRASESLRSSQEGSKFFSLGNDYIEVLDRGRGAGSYAPVDSIREWVRSKLGITEETELKQIAFLVNRKLKREGSAIFKDPSKGLEIDNKIATLNRNLTKDLQVFAVSFAKKQLSSFQSTTL